MVTCPWCDEGSEDLLADIELLRCTACGTCVELVDEAPVLDVAA